MFRTFWLVLTFLFVPVTWAEPAEDNKAYQTVSINSKKLRAGQFVWNKDGISSGIVTALVSIPEQRLYLYRDGTLIAVSTVSTGRRGYGTPAGVFSILEKDRHHRSRTYDNAPMPFANRLTWGGVALHAGNLPGYPASHGCIRLPTQFARNLFNVSSLGMTVIVMGYEGQSFRLGHPSALPPVDFMEGKLVSLELSPTEEFSWKPENSPEGPLSIVISEKDQYLLVYRNGIEIGRTKISMTLAEDHLGTHAFIMQEGEIADRNPLLTHRWLIMGNNKDNAVLDASFFEHLHIPTDFINTLNGILASAVGTTLLITDRPLLERSNTIKTASTFQPRCVRGNCIHGRGTQIYTDGSKYIGEFKNGVSEGQGQLIFSNGEKYVGEFKNDRYQWD